MALWGLPGPAKVLPTRRGWWDCGWLALACILGVRQPGQRCPTHCLAWDSVQTWSPGSSHPCWTAGWAGFLERACPLGLGLLSAGAHVYPGRAGRTWLLSLVLGNLDSCPWTATKTLPSRPRRRAEHVASVRMLQVSGLVFLVFSARPASVTLHYCHLPFRSLHRDSF